VRLDAPNAVPLYSVYPQIVYSLKAGDVTQVMVNGRWIVRSGKMLTLDRAAVSAEADKYRRKVEASVRQ
jgi:cytosine/adenosine deaminase-related metal-dependent hydrolase